MQRLLAAIPEGAENITVVFSESPVAGFDCSGSWVFRKEASQDMHCFFKHIARQGVGKLQELSYDLDGVHHERCMNEEIIEYWKVFAESLQSNLV